MEKLNVVYVSLALVLAAFVTGSFGTANTCLPDNNLWCRFRSQSFDQIPYDIYYASGRQVCPFRGCRFYMNPEDVSCPAAPSLRRDVFKKSQYDLPPGCGQFYPIFIYVNGSWCNIGETYNRACVEAYRARNQ